MVDYQSEKYTYCTHVQNILKNIKRKKTVMENDSAT